MHAPRHTHVWYGHDDKGGLRHFGRSKHDAGGPHEEAENNVEQEEEEATPNAGNISQVIRMQQMKRRIRDDGADERNDDVAEHGAGSGTDQSLEDVEEHTGGNTAGLQNLDC